MGASKEKSWGGNYPSPHQPLCWSLNTFCNELMAKAQYKAARKGLWVASPYAAIYLCDNKRIVFLSSLLAPQRAAFEAGTDDSRSHLGSAVGCPCGNWEIPKNLWLMTEIQSPMCPVGKNKNQTCTCGYCANVLCWCNEAWSLNSPLLCFFKTIRIFFEWEWNKPTFKTGVTEFIFLFNV